MEINIPLLEAVKQIPRYAKFLKELCINRKKLKGDEIVSMGETASAIILRKMPEKCSDPGMISLPCVIGNKRIERAMLDLGASINVMPYSVYCDLNLGPMNRTGVIIKLADRSKTRPVGVVEDILVQVNKLIFSADFFIMKTEDDNNDVPDSATLLLGRPFMLTAKTNIDLDECTVSVKFDGDVVKFNLFDSMKYPVESHSLCSIDIIDSVVQDIFEEKHEDAELEVTNLLEKIGETDARNEIQELFSWMVTRSLNLINDSTNFHKGLLPSVF